MYWAVPFILTVFPAVWLWPSVKDCWATHEPYMVDDAPSQKGPQHPYKRTVGEKFSCAVKHLVWLALSGAAGYSAFMFGTTFWTAGH
ncbi:hypothetical protein DFO46_2515 [Rhizobium sp. AG855]|nr:hypothetical protein DFO46_2515 [Rhizobium sp. AG855]